MNQSCNFEIRETDIAIIGLACCFPGANNPEQFWQNLRDGRESIEIFDDDYPIANAE